MSCEECAEVYEAESDEPPCDECDKPELMQRNYFAWHLWEMCDGFERPSQEKHLTIPLTSIIEVVSAYGGDEREVEKVKLLERERASLEQKSE